MEQIKELKCCAYCGKLMERKRYTNGVLQSWNEYNRQKYCNRECMKKAFRKKPHKGTSWMTVHYHARNLLSNGCCEICGSNKNVDVHHKDGNPQNNSKDNLMRVCRSCHNKIHRPHKTCVICGKKVKGYGYCEKHYQRFKKYGNPFAVKRGNHIMLLED